MKDILNRYQLDVAKAFDEFADNLWSIGRGASGNPILPSDNDVRAAVAKYSGRLSARCTAANKQAKRTLITNRLLELKSDGMDITPTVALHCAKRVLPFGRGLDTKKLLELFATPGRTASSKSTVTEQTLNDVEESLLIDISSLENAMTAIKSREKDNWQNSSTRADIMDDWANQRRGNAC